MNRKSRSTHPIEDVQLFINTVDRTAGPSIKLEADLDKQVKDAAAKGARDAGQYDSIAVACTPPELLVGDREIESGFDALSNEITQREASATSAEASLKEQLGVVLRVKEYGKPWYKVAMCTVEENLAQAKSAVDTLTDRIAFCTSVLQGKEVDENQIGWTGRVPATPSPDTTAKDVKRAIRGEFLRQHWFLLFCAIDIVVVWWIVQEAFRNNGWQMIALALSIGIIALCALPLAVGHALASTYRRGYWVPKDTAVIVVVTLFWLGAAVLATYMRVDVERANAILHQATTLGVEPSSIDPDAVYNVWLYAPLWFVIVFAPGLTVLLLEMFTRNPMVQRLLRCHLELIDARDSVTRYTEIAAWGGAAARASAAGGGNLGAEFAAERALTASAHARAHAAYHEALGRESEDSDMPQAIEAYRLALRAAGCGWVS